MILCSNVSLEYQRGKPVLSGITMEIKAGTFYFLTGPSGAGKTSLLSMLALLQRPTHGRITMFGEETTKLAREDLPRLRRRIGFVTQDFRLLNHLTVEQNVGLPLKVAGERPPQIKAKVKELLGWIGLADCRDMKPETLSGGQKQRVAIARAVITKPDLLLADEPTGNLDSQLALRFMYLFEALNESGTTVMMATHDDHLISAFNHPTLRLKDGHMQ